MDSWDPALVNALAETRPVIVFDNTGVGKSSGTTPDSVEQMTADAATLMAAFGLKQVDLLGYSLGGCIAQVPGAIRHCAAKHAPASKRGPAEPVDGTVLGDKRGRLAVTNEYLILDATRHGCLCLEIDDQP